MSGSPTLPSLFAQKIVVGVGDAAVSNNPNVILSTYALGSCIGLIVWDPAATVGGLLHFMLPEASLSPDKASAQPAMFGDSGMAFLLQSLRGLKADPSRLRAFCAGGASVLSGPDMFRIGERNTKMAQGLLARHRIPCVGAETGGINNRTVHLDIGQGQVTLKVLGREHRYSLR
ncbi:MAG: chemotaxis protein CheD [Puniceicoccaceae bacterium]|nr:MAG: chemotaxis protein CheD [Puniceicoccaceae bacterium]